MGTWHFIRPIGIFANIVKNALEMVNKEGAPSLCSIDETDDGHEIRIKFSRK
jgi:hypothetical protein